MEEVCLRAEAPEKLSCMHTAPLGALGAPARLCTTRRFAASHRTCHLLPLSPHVFQFLLFILLFLLLLQQYSGLITAGLSKALPANERTPSALCPIAVCRSQAESEASFHRLQQPLLHSASINKHLRSSEAGKRCDPGIWQKSRRCQMLSGSAQSHRRASSGTQIWYSARPARLPLLPESDSLRCTFPSIKMSSVFLNVISIESK